MLRLWSTCPACQLVLKVHEPGQQHHPCCQPSHPTGDELVDAFLAAAEAGDDTTADQLQAAIDAEDQRHRPLLPAALTYISWGWPVFPLQPGTKEPYPGSRGFKDATLDAELVHKWWTRAPESNIGVATGIAFDVLDVDWLTKDTLAPTGAQESWPQLRDSGALPDAHGMTTTPRGGVHLLLLPTGGGNKAGFLPGLDYRGRGGYIVAPPSRDEHGRRYAWRHHPSPTLTGVEVDSPKAGAAA